MASIQLTGIGKQFGDTIALRDIDLAIADGEFIVFVGPSGCGKSTLLRIIAGLEEPTNGQIAIDGKQVTRTPAAKRGLSMVFQSYGLYPHMTVRDNMAFGLKMAKLPAADIERRVNAAAETPAARRTPRQKTAPALRRPTATSRHRPRDSPRTLRLPL